MIITACLPPPLPPISEAVETVDNCRAFHGIDAFLEWAKENGIDTKCAEWRWP